MKNQQFRIPSKLTIFIDANLIHEDKTEQKTLIQITFTHIKEDLFRISTQDHVSLSIQNTEGSNENRSK